MVNVLGNFGSSWPRLRLCTFCERGLKNVKSDLILEYSIFFIAATSSVSLKSETVPYNQPNRVARWRVGLVQMGGQINFSPFPMPNHKSLLKWHSFVKSSVAVEKLSQKCMLGRNYPQVKIARDVLPCCGSVSFVVWLCDGIRFESRIYCCLKLKDWLARTIYFRHKKSWQHRDWLINCFRYRTSVPKKRTKLIVICRGKFSFFLFTFRRQLTHFGRRVSWKPPACCTSRSFSYCCGEWDNRFSRKNYIVPAKCPDFSWKGGVKGGKRKPRFGSCWEWLRHH